MAKKSLIIFLFFILAAPLLAHEFWLQPERFIYQPGETINLRFWVGENFEGNNWGGNHTRINSLQLYLDGVTDDLSNQLSDEKGDSLQLALYDEGTAMITFNSNNSFIELEADKFNSYLQDDGMQNVIDYRTKHHETDSAGKEAYQRSVKTIVQVGDTKNNISYTTTLPLDIIPLTNPYLLKDTGSLAVRVLFKKTPLSNQFVQVWQRTGDSTVRQSYHTNENGEFSFTVNTTGKWMVSTVRMVRLNKDGANWQSYWGSCTWGYE